MILIKFNFKNSKLNKNKVTNFFKRTNLFVKLYSASHSCINIQTTIVVN